MTRISMRPQYAPPAASAAQSVYWKPGALSMPPVAYPIVGPGGPAPTTPRGAGVPRARPQPVAPPRPAPEQVLGVNVNSGGWPIASTPRGWNGPGQLDPQLYKNHTVNMGGGGGYSSPNGIAGQFKEMLDKANQANEARYQDVLGGYQSRYERGLDLLKGMGQQEAKDIAELADNQAASTRQRLTDRGLANSTVLDTMLSGVDREQAANLGRLYDRVRQQALQTDAGLSGDTLQFMERRTDEGPEMQLLAQLMQKLGAGGLGGGVGGGYASPSMGEPIFQRLGGRVTPAMSAARTLGSYDVTPGRLEDIARTA